MRPNPKFAMDKILEFDWHCSVKQWLTLILNNFPCPLKIQPCITCSSQTFVMRICLFMSTPIICDNFRPILTVNLSVLFPTGRINLKKIVIEKYAIICIMDQNSFICIHQIRWHHWESVAGSVIQATRTGEFEDCLRTWVLPWGCWCHWGGRTYPRINTNPPKGHRLVIDGVVVKRSPFSDQISILPCSAHRWYWIIALMWC